jgi:uncharacterized protein (TIGR02118 family)
MSYYFERHVPLVQQKLGPALKSVSVDVGLGGGQPGSPPTYAVMFHMLFDSVESYQQAFGPHAEAIVGDIPNYTNTQPTIQMSEVKLAPPKYGLR